MGRGRGACKFLGIIFIFSLLLQGSCTAESTNNVSTDILNGTINGTINGKIIGTINSTANNTTNNKDNFQWVLLLPIFLGSLLFLCWVCRFFDEMNFCFIIFILIALLLGFLSFSLHSKEIPGPLIALRISFLIPLIISFIVIVISYEAVKQRKKDESNLIMSLHDIARNFIVIIVILSTNYTFNLWIKFFYPLFCKR
jgi:hypothetical protein